MKGKSGIITLTAIISVLCLYYLSFTFVARNVQSEAATFATDSKGNVDFAKKQKYLDSMWTEPVYNLGFATYTYEDVKKNELALGLDLQGGMHVVLEVSPGEIVKAMAGSKSKNPQFQKAVELAKEKQKNSQASFAELFAEAFEELNPQVKLAQFFANINYKELNSNSSNDEVVATIEQEMAGAVDRSFQVLRARIDKFGVANPNIQKLPTSGRIQVELPGVDNPERARKLLSGAAKLEFFQVYELDELTNSLIQLKTFVDSTEAKASTKKENTDLFKQNDGVKDTEEAQPFQTEDDTAQSEEAQPFQTENDTAQPEEAQPFQTETDTTPEVTQPFQNTDTTQANTTDSATTLNQDTAEKATIPVDSVQSDSANNLLQGSAFQEIFLVAGRSFNIRIKDTARVNRILAKEEVQAMFPQNVAIMWAVKPFQDKKSETNPLNGTLELYFIKKSGREGKPLLEGSVISSARASRDEKGQPAVSMTMNIAGAKKWAKITEENKDKRIAIVLDDVVYSAPNVMGKISGGQSSITGDFTVEESQDLANILKSGKLPAPLRIVEEAIVGPSLGEESISQGLWSIVVGIGLVIVFMGFYYSSSGLVANLALILNVFFIFGVLVPLGAVLTLPGIAGIVLTIGMAVDANVLIFERIREELRNGLQLKQAISLGYGKALSSIIDANVTTFLTGLILFVFGSGAVKGFATVLMVGIACSLFSAVVISRIVVESLAKDVNKPKVSFKSALTKAVRGFFEENNFQFIKHRKKAYVFSALMIALGITSIVLQGGMNLGVDFSGGRSYVVEFNSPMAANEVRNTLESSFENKGTEVKTFGANNKLKITTSYLINEESQEADEQVRKALSTGLEKYSKEEPEVLSSTKVGATVADDIRNSSLLAGIFSVIVIFIYILVRFRQWQYGLGAIAALVHDILMVLSLYSIANLLGLSLEVDQVFVAAVLTIIGYSINDTVVVFDRIREFSGRFSKQDLSITLNNALNQTLSRTIITAVTTFIVVVVLLLAGGEVLRGFSFALFIGVIFGTYSSLFVASPIVLDLAKKQLEKAQKGAAQKAKASEKKIELEKS